MRYFIGFLVSIGLIIFIIVLLFHGGGSPKVPKTSKTLESYAGFDTSSVRLTIDGVINSAQEHQTVQITVRRDSVNYAQISGYDGSVVNNQTYANTERSYAVFLQALTHAGFTQGNPDKKMNDERGYCALGRRYIYEVVQNNQDVERFWSTSCGKPKTYLGNASLTEQLFKNQVPNYNDLTFNLNHL